MSDLIRYDDLYLTIANSQKIRKTGIAKVGTCQFSIVPELSKPLISESFLTKNFRLYTIHFEDRLFIYHYNTDSTTRLIATATSRDDGLYVLDNLSNIIEYLANSNGHNYKTVDDQYKDSALEATEQN